MAVRFYVRDLGGRYLCGNTVLIRCPRIVRLLDAEAECDAIAAAAFIHPVKGLCFFTLALADFREGKIIEGRDVPLLEIPYGTLKNDEVRGCLQSKAWNELEDRFEKAYRPYMPGEIQQCFRDTYCYDPFRKETDPDILLVRYRSVILEVFPDTITEYNVGGTVVREPEQECAVHKGDRVFFTVLKSGDSAVLTVCPEIKSRPESAL